METLSLPTIKQDGFRTTDGRYPHDFLQRQVTNWIKLTLQTKHEAPLNKPLTVHLDHLLGIAVDRDNLVAVSFQTFLVLIEELESQGIISRIHPLYIPALYIPLECSESLIAGPFDSETLIQEVDHHDSPSLYLIEPRMKTKTPSIEQYIFPLPVLDFVEKVEGMRVYYNATRSAEDIKHGWEYGRNIVAEYHPPAYHSTL